nr:hypothetical protein RJW52_05365 [Streptococcus suis]
MAMVKVKAICNFADSKSNNGIRFLGEVFETSQERVEFLNGLRDFPLVEIIEEVLEEKPVVEIIEEVLEEKPVVEIIEEVLEEKPVVEIIEEVLEEKPIRKRKKRVSESDSDNVSDEKTEPTSVEIATSEV